MGILNKNGLQLILKQDPISLYILLQNHRPIVIYKVVTGDSERILWMDRLSDSMSIIMNPFKDIKTPYTFNAYLLLLGVLWNKAYMFRNVCMFYIMKRLSFLIYFEMHDFILKANKNAILKRSKHSLPIKLYSKTENFCLLQTPSFIQLRLYLKHANVLLPYHYQPSCIDRHKNRTVFFLFERMPDMFVAHRILLT